MDKKNRKTLRQIYADPDKTFTRWIDVEHLCAALGGDAVWTDKHHLELRLNGQHESFKTPEDKSARLDAKDGEELRSFFTSAGVTASMADANGGDSQ